MAKHTPEELARIGEREAANVKEQCRKLSEALERVAKRNDTESQALRTVRTACELAPEYYGTGNLSDAIGEALFDSIKRIPESQDAEAESHARQIAAACESYANEKNAKVKELEAQIDWLNWQIRNAREIETNHRTLAAYLKRGRKW